jgi:hypothetical protein
VMTNKLNMNDFQNKTNDPYISLHILIYLNINENTFFYQHFVPPPPKMSITLDSIFLTLGVPSNVFGYPK